jgi:hypothetical protein
MCGARSAAEAEADAVAEAAADAAAVAEAEADAVAESDAVAAAVADADRLLILEARQRQCLQVRVAGELLRLSGEQRVYLGRQNLLLGLVES